MSAKEKETTKEVKKEESAKPAKKLNAAQKLSALESTISEMEENFQKIQAGVINKINELEQRLDSNSEILAKEIDKITNTTRSIIKRLNATIQAGESGQLSSQSVNELLLEEANNELKNKVKQLVDVGAMTKNDNATISDSTFVVARELDDQGNVINPRLQFHVGSLAKEMKAPLLGKKLGDKIKTDEAELTVEITELYDVKVVETEQKYEEEVAEEEATEDSE